MRKLMLILLAALAAPLGAHAQSWENKDWLVVCDNSRTCRAAGYSPEGSGNPVSVLIARASGPGMPVFGELQLGSLDVHGVHPASVGLVIGGRSAGTIRVDRNNHAELAPAATGALLKALLAGSDISFTAGKTTWRLSGDGAVDALQRIDDLQGRAGTVSAIVRKGGARDSDVASPMAVPRFEAGNIPTARQADDDALVVRVLAAIQSNPACPLQIGRASCRERV